MVWGGGGIVRLLSWEFSQHILKLPWNILTKLCHPVERFSGNIYNHLRLIIEPYTLNISTWCQWETFVQDTL